VTETASAFAIYEYEYSLYSIGIQFIFDNERHMNTSEYS